MKIWIIAGLLFPLSSWSQHYYHDIMGTEETNQKIQLLASLGITAINSKGFDENNRPVTGFSEKQHMNPGTRTLTTTRSIESGTSTETILFDEKFRMLKIVDSTASTLTTTSYSYDENNRVILIRNIIRDSEYQIADTESHHWSYDTEGLPEQMVRTVNGGDSTIFRFKQDENGNIIEETAYKRDMAADVVYYYYNDDDDLTDIVRYNTRARRLLPDFMFEYDGNGRVIQKITTIPNQKIGYITWRYQYNDKGLKIREANFTKEKKLIGRIDYEYGY